ncbi:hypothetical protein BJX76DRAFT_337650, partial [Aspergillus varians]
MARLMSYRDQTHNPCCSCSANADLPHLYSSVGMGSGPDIIVALYYFSALHNNNVQIPHIQIYILLFPPHPGAVPHCLRAANSCRVRENV